MRLRLLALLALAAFVGSCTEHGPTGPSSRPRLLFDNNPNLAAVRFSEIHYDNSGTDVGEAIEVSGPAGMDVTGWQVVLYNGNGGAVYGTTALSGTIPATCDLRGVIVLTYPSNGIQNGSPDGFALVDGSGQVVEFLSYEGTFAATNGPALGVTSTDIGVAEAGTEPAGQSLQRSGAGTWSGPVASTFGACNDDVVPPPAEVASVTVQPATATVAQGNTATFTATAYDAAAQPVPGVTFTWSSSASAIATVSASGVATAVAPGDAVITASAPNGVAASAALRVTLPGLADPRFTEIHYDNSGTDAGEAIEIEGPAGTDVTGWTVVLYNGTGGAPYNTQTLSGTIPATCDTRGVVVINYPVNGIQNGSPDGMALVNAGGQVVEFLSYEGTFTAVGGPASGLASTDIGVLENGSDPAGLSLQRSGIGSWSAPATSTFGACNGGGGPPPPPQTRFTFSGRSPTADPALPVGFQDQLFVTVVKPGNDTVTAPVTWSTETPTLASIDQRGVITALGAGTAIFRATTQDASATATYSLPFRVATASTTAQYAGNAEFGEPADNDPSDDFIVRRDQYTASFNRTRGIPNWVSYDMDATVFGSEDRCDCFTYDPLLPASFTRYTTADYTGAGTFAGYGIDRGHLTRSFDRTSASLDNATTFYFSNVVPQAADLNQGPWANMENYLGDLARLQNMEVYVIAGASGSKGTVKNEGLITIPAFTWKVAVILPRDQGLSSIRTFRDLQVIAAIMPNEPGIRNVDWNSYRTTVDAVEALSGYDLLALLPDQVEIAVESNTSPPTAAVNGPFTSLEGSPVTMSASGSSDPDGDALTYVWSFGDGSTASGPTVSHTYAQNGVYPVRVAVTDIRGLVDTASTTATVSNVAPTIAGIPGALLLPGETYQAGGSFTDPGADTWNATVDYGDGSGVMPLALSGMQFSLSHTYAAAGTFTVTVRVGDGDDVSAGTGIVTVMTPVQGTDRALALVAQLLDDGLIGHGQANSLAAKLDAAKQQLERGHVTPAANVLGALLNELDAMVHSGHLASADAALLRMLVTRLIRTVTA